MRVYHLWMRLPTASTIIRYISWLGLKGTVHASSLQPYLSAINNYFRLHHREPVALGPLVTAARQSLAKRQRTINPGPARIYLPADAVFKIFKYGYEYLQGVRPPDATAFRNIVATVFAFFFFDRSGTTRAVRDGDVSVSTDTVVFLVYHRKGKDDVPDTQRPKLVIRHQYFATLMAGYLRLRAQLPVVPPYFFALPQDTPESWSAKVQTDWLQQSLSLVGVFPPAGFVYTSHSLRSGSASAARAVGWTLEQIEYWGGWSLMSKALRQSYIVPTVQACPAAKFFFDWFLSVRPPAPLHCEGLRLYAGKTTVSPWKMFIQPWLIAVLLTLIGTVLVPRVSASG